MNDWWYCLEYPVFGINLLWKEPEWTKPSKGKKDKRKKEDKN